MVVEEEGFWGIIRAQVRFPGVSGGKVWLQCRRPGFDPWVGKIPWRRKWQPTPVFLPGKSHGLRSLVGYSPWGRKESDTTERLHFHFQNVNRMGEEDFSLWRGLRMWGHQAPVLPWGLLFIEFQALASWGVCPVWAAPVVTVSQSQAPPSGFRAAHLKEGMEFKTVLNCGTTLLLWEITCRGFEGARKMAQDGSRDTERNQMIFWECVPICIYRLEKSDKAGMFKNIIFYSPCFSLVLPSEVKNLCRRPGFNPRVRKIPWRREWQPTPVFLPRESHGQRSHGVAKSCIWLRDFHVQDNIYYLFFWLQISICLQRKFGQYLDFPGDPVVKTLHFQCKGQGFNPW